MSVRNLIKEAADEESFVPTALSVFAVFFGYVAFEYFNIGQSVCESLAAIFR